MDWRQYGYPDTYNLDDNSQGKDTGNNQGNDQGNQPKNNKTRRPISNAIQARINRGRCLWCDQNSNMFKCHDDPCPCQQYLPKYEYGSQCECGHSEIWHQRNNMVKKRLDHGPIITEAIGPYISSLYTKLRATEEENKSLMVRLRSQNELTTDSNLCSVCYKARKDTVFLPCRHAQFCNGCSKKWLATHQTCPLCRAKVDCILDIII